MCYTRHSLDLSVKSSEFNNWVELGHQRSTLDFVSAQAKNPQFALPRYLSWNDTLHLPLSATLSRHRLPRHIHKLENCHIGQIQCALSRPVACVTGSRSLTYISGKNILTSHKIKTMEHLGGTTVLWRDVPDFNVHIGTELDLEPPIWLEMGQIQE